MDAGWSLVRPKHADFQAFPRPEIGKGTSAQRESNPHFRHGKTAGCRYIMGAFSHNHATDLSMNKT